MADSKELQAARQSSFTPQVGTASRATTARPPNPRYDGRRAISNGARIQIGRIQPDPEQPRKTFGTDADTRLAESMRTRGQIVPIIVRWSEATEHYVVLDGERRYRAAVAAGLAEMLCVEEDEADPDVILELQLVANALREDVAPVEQARAWDRLMKSQNLTQRELADKLGYTVGSVNKKLALLGLPEEFQSNIDDGLVKAETGYFIAQIEDPAEQAVMIEQAKDGDLTRDAARERVARSKARAGGKGVGSSKARGRGGKPKPLGERIFRDPDDKSFRLIAVRPRGIEPAALITLLEHALAVVRGELAETQVPAP